MLKTPAPMRMVLMLSMGTALLLGAPTPRTRTPMTPGSVQ